MIARAGIASRRKAEELIIEGLVKVNGQKIVVPQHQVTAGQDKVLVALADRFIPLCNLCHCTMVALES